jgi:hypothetical protein
MQASDATGMEEARGSRQSKKPITGRAAQEKHVRSRLRDCNKMLNSVVSRLDPNRVGGQFMFSLVASARSIDDNSHIFLYSSQEMQVCAIVNASPCATDVARKTGYAVRVQGFLQSMRFYTVLERLSC